MPQTTTPGNAPVQVIERALDLLEALATGPQTVTELSRQTGLAKGTAYRLLAGLSHRRAVLKEPLSNRYMLGPSVLSLVTPALSAVSAILTISHDQLAALARETEETVALHVPVGIERVCVGEVESAQPIRYTSGVGSAAPLHIGAAGRVLLASFDVPQRQRYLQFLRSTATSKDFKVSDLEATLAVVARDGWAISSGERVSGASAISVPITNSLMPASLSILGPETRLPRERLLAMLPRLEAAANAIADLMNQLGAE